MRWLRDETDEPRGSLATTRPSRGWGLFVFMGLLIGWGHGAGFLGQAEGQAWAQPGGDEASGEGEASPTPSAGAKGNATARPASEESGKPAPREGEGEDTEAEVQPRPAAGEMPRPRPAAGEMPRPEGSQGPSARPGDEAQPQSRGVKTAGRPAARGPQAGAADKEGEEGAEKNEDKGYEPAGPTLTLGNLGFQYGLTDDSVGGFKMGFSYGYRLTNWMWFDAQVNFSFGGDCKGEAPSAGEPKEYACNSVHGFGIEAIAGVQWKFYGIKKWKAPVVPFAKAGLGVVAIVSNGPNDGAALVARGSGGVRYHFFKWFAVGGEVGVTLGPAFRNELDTGFYAAVDVAAGAEFHF